MGAIPCESSSAATPEAPVGCWSAGTALFMSCVAGWIGRVSSEAGAASDLRK
jgi:hypothetical protein